MQHTQQHRRGPVVVVIVDRVTALRALEVAAEEAARRRTGLVVIPETRPDCRQTERPTGSWLAQRVDDLHRTWPDLHTEVLPAAVAPDAVTRAARTARLLVVCSGAPVGSLAGGGCPVLVVDPHGDRRAPQRVVVALVSSDGDAATMVRVAAAEARARRSELRVIHPFVPRSGESGLLAAHRANRLVTQLVRSTAQGLVVTVFCITDHAPERLARYTRGAELLVVDAAHRPHPTTPVDQLLRLAGCSVLVLRPLAAAAVHRLPRADRQPRLAAIPAAVHGSRR